MVEAEFHSYWICFSGREGADGDAFARFPYWSFTKTAISVSAMKLSEIGALDLDARSHGQPFTLRQLLGHTAGLPDYGQFKEYHRAVADNEPPWSRDKLLELVWSNGLLFEPGTSWSYSNVGYMIAKERIEEVAGQSLGAVICELICKPLGLKSIELAETREQFSRLRWRGAAHYDPGWVYHGCLTGTAADAARLLHGLFNGDLLMPETRELMLDVYPLGGAVPGRPWTACGYALGLMSGKMEGAGRAIGHSGAGPFSANAIYYFPDQADAVTVACFTDAADEGVAEFRTAQLEAWQAS